MAWGLDFLYVTVTNERRNKFHQLKFAFVGAVNVEKFFIYVQKPNIRKKKKKNDIFGYFRCTYMNRVQILVKGSMT